MNMFKRCKLLLLAALFIFFTQTLHAANTKRYYEDSSNTVLREMRASLDDLRHEVSNHETEIKTYEEKIQSLESIIDSIRQQSTDTAQAHKDALKDSSSTLEIKLTSLETTVKSLVTDLKQFKNHANDTASVLAQYKGKLTELEKLIEIQNQNLDTLQAALKSITDALQIKSNIASSSEKTYKIAPGDSLEKIARKHHTTIQTIKDLNNLTNDRIIVGQTLKVP